MTGASVRLFAALDLPAVVRARLSAWAAGAVGEREELRLLAEDSFHVTLCFLGWRPAGEAEEIGRLVVGCAAPVNGLELGAGAWFAPRRPRVLAVEVVDAEGALGRLQARVSEVLAAGAGYQPESRPFRPHVTVARVRGRARLRAFDLPDPPPCEFAGTALTLYRSHPGRGGATYEALARAPLSNR